MFDINIIYKGEFIMALIDTEGSAINLNSGAGCNGGFGFGNNDAWVLIILFALIFGWNGNNGFGGGNSGAANNYVLASDFATIQRQLSDGFGDLTSQTRFIQNGLCDGFYAMNTSLLNGFAGTNNAIMTNGYETRNAINGVASQLAGCCCDIKTAIGDVKYANAINTRDIIESNNANYRALHDEIVANRIEDKNAQIAAQQNEINALRLKASQTEQNQYLIGQLKPCPSAAYIVPNPNCCYNYSVTPNGCGGTCGSVL